MNLKTLEMLLKGLATYIPGYQSVKEHLRESCPGGTISAPYCYSVWLRHLVLAHARGLPADPEVVAEIGPGNSLGVGLAALLTGAQTYYAFDKVAYAHPERNLQVLEGLITLFQTRAGIPEEAELKPKLPDYAFPHHLLTEGRLARCLSPQRLEQIKSALLKLNQPCQGMYIGYVVPWDGPGIIRDNSVDLILSSAVLEHVDDLEATYRALYRWLKPGGFASHQIDYRCHGMAREWNGHWAYGDTLWRLIYGKRPYVINRIPHSGHLALMRGSGFQIVGEQKVRNTAGLPREKLAPRFQGLAEDDLVTSGAFVQALKEGPSAE